MKKVCALGTLFYLSYVRAGLPPTHNILSLSSLFIIVQTIYEVTCRITQSQPGGSQGQMPSTQGAEARLGDTRSFKKKKNSEKKKMMSSLKQGDGERKSWRPHGLDQEIAAWILHTLNMTYYGQLQHSPWLGMK